MGGGGGLKVTLVLCFVKTKVLFLRLGLGPSWTIELVVIDQLAEKHGGGKTIRVCKIYNTGKINRMTNTLLDTFNESVIE